MISLITALLAALGGVALTTFEQQTAGNHRLPNPLGLMITSLVSWTAFGLSWLLALLTGTLILAILAGLIAFALWRTGAALPGLARYTALRTPLAFGALFLALALWLGTFALVEI